MNHNRLMRRGQDWVPPSWCAPAGPRVIKTTTAPDGATRLLFLYRRSSKLGAGIKTTNGCDLRHNRCALD